LSVAIAQRAAAEGIESGQNKVATSREWVHAADGIKDLGSATGKWDVYSIRSCLELVHSVRPKQGREVRRDSVGLRGRRYRVQSGQEFGMGRVRVTEVVVRVAHGQTVIVGEPVIDARRQVVHILR